MNSQKLTIDTPEQISLEYDIAGVGSRFMALFVDMMIQFIVGIVLVIALAFTGFSLTSFFASSSWTIALIVLVIFTIQWGYFAIFEIVWKGQTPGKRQAGIRVINETGREASMYEAITRNLLRAFDSMPGIYAVGVIVMFLSPQNKRVGDYVAGTIVVHDRKPEEYAIFYNTEQQETLDAFNYAVLTATDLEVLETFLQRRLDLDYEVRQRTADKLARHFREKCGIPLESSPDNENLLEKLVRGFRRNARLGR